jgi:eukaryotic-like serine/threonine-protein kinase
MTADAGVREGDVLANKYRIDRILGEGAMGVVVAARHLKLDERVAIKFLQPETLANAEAVARFEREARAAVRIKSEHVARVFDVGTLENGAPYMVMEHLEGGDLAAWLQQRGPLPIEQTVEFVLQALEAIAEAHGLGIVHRDLKPANLFCIRRADGLLSIKVLDFGISKIGGAGASASDMNMTRTSDVMGSPLYMSPEQMQSSRDVDATTDIWALGIILFQLLTGKAPFVAANMPELVMKIAMSAPERLRGVLPQAPEGLERIILRCLEKDRTKRYPNVAELAVALVEFGPKRSRSSAERISRVIQAAGLSTSELAPPPSSGPVLNPVAEQTIDAWGQTSPKKARGAGRVIGAALAIVAVLALGITVYLGKSTASRETSPSDPPATAAGPVVIPKLEISEPRATAAAAPIVPPAAPDPPKARDVEAPVATGLPAPRANAESTPVAPPNRNTRLPSPRPAASVQRPATRPQTSAAPAPADTGSAYDERK